MYKWDFTPVFANWPLLAQGLLNTLKVTGVALSCGLVLGLALALLRLSRHRGLSWPAGFVIEVFRTTPPLVQLFWFFFALPILMPFEISPLAAAALGISLNSAAFSAEIYRGGIQSIERGQWDAARALGDMPDEAIADRILGELRTSVRLRKLSDVPVGVFLSGGLDSSTNAALFSEGEGRPIRTFSIGYDRDYSGYANELHFARAMAERIGAEHHERRLTRDDVVEFHADADRFAQCMVVMAGHE